MEEIGEFSSVFEFFWFFFYEVVVIVNFELMLYCWVGIWICVMNDKLVSRVKI